MGQHTLLHKQLEKSDSMSGGGDKFIAGNNAILRCAIDCLEDGIAITQQKQGINQPILVYANPTWTSLFGIGLNASPTGNDELNRLIHESHQSSDVFSADFIACGLDGSRRMFRLRSAPFKSEETETSNISHRVANVRDITRQIETEDALRRNERLACIGLLAAGIAHEINNPTGSAMLAAETALAILDSPDSRPHVAACLENIVKSMDRCGRIVRTILRYSRDEPTEKQACNINDVANQAVELSRPYAEQIRAEFHLDLDPEPPLALMNPLEIELVLVNLIRNAVEASPKDTTITIRTRHNSDSVQVAVIDVGCGMTKEQLEHVFDPLYTTRRSSGGSGLGMSIAYGIVKGHKGRMEVQSQPGKGTTVTIDLPIRRDS